MLSDDRGESGDNDRVLKPDGGWLMGDCVVLDLVLCATTDLARLSMVGAGGKRCCREKMAG